MRTWTVGKARITQVVEQVMPEGIPGLIPDATPEALLAIPWLYPEFITAKGEPSLSLHAYIIDTPTRRIMVDTCIGNDKDLKMAPFWDQMQTDFLDRMRAAGFAPESIDVVVCTHLHLDHVGWNTMKVDERWVPTFTNARYLFARPEYEFLQTADTDPDLAEEWRMINASVKRESVQPVVDAGLADFVATDHRITEEVALIPTHGHTPGHVSIVIQSEGERVIITGDCAHHPCQLARPDWGTTADIDADMARQTRWRLFGDIAGSDCLVLGTHWTGVGGGQVVRDGAAFRLQFEPAASRGRK